MKFPDYIPKSQVSNVRYITKRWIKFINVYSDFIDQTNVFLIVFIIKFYIPDCKDNENRLKKTYLTQRMMYPYSFLADLNKLYRNFF